MVASHDERQNMSTDPVDPREAWPSSTKRSMVITALRAAGMSSDDIACWLTAKPYFGVIDHVEEILKWVDTFGTIPGSREWYDTMLPREEAVAWARAGYTPSQAERLTSEIFMKALTPHLEPIASQEEWLASGLPPQWVLRCFSVGIREPRLARTMFDEARSAPPEVDD